MEHHILALQAAQAQSEALAGGVDQVDQACQVCMQRDGPTMLLCHSDECDAGYHMSLC